jgi:hypothetical protein
VATRGQIIDGLIILDGYPGDAEVLALHGVLYAGGPPPEKMSAADRKALEKLRWHWNEECQCWGRCC